MIGRSPNLCHYEPLFTITCHVCSLFSVSTLGISQQVGPSARLDQLRCGTEGVPGAESVAGGPAVAGGTGALGGARDDWSYQQ